MPDIALESISAVNARLASLRRRIRMIFLFDGLARVFLALGAAALLLMSLDLALVLPYAVRVVTSSLAVAAGLVVAWRNLAYPLTRTLRNDDLAVVVERRFPALHDRLISAIQFARGFDFAQQYASPALMREVVRDAVAFTGRLRFDDVLRPRPMNGLRIMLVLGIGALVGAGAATDARMRCLVQRVAFQDVAFPVRTLLSVGFEGRDWPLAQRRRAGYNFHVDADSRTVRAVSDSNLRVLATLEKYPATHASIAYSVAGRRRERRMVAERSGGKPVRATSFLGALGLGALGLGESDTGEIRAVFSHRFENLIASREFRVSGGDAVSRPWRVEVVPAPRIQRMQLTYHYPPYLRREDHTVSSTEIEAPEGTLVSVRVDVNRPLPPGGARLLMLDEERYQPIVMEALGGDGRAFRTPAGQPVEVGPAEKFRIALEDRHGLVNLRARTFRIVALEDKAPGFIGRDCDYGQPLGKQKVIMITPRASFDIRVAAEDDQGLERVTLEYRVGGGKTQAPAVFTRRFGVAGPFPRRVTERFPLVTADLKDAAGRPLSVDDVFVLQAIIEDNFERGVAPAGPPGDQPEKNPPSGGKNAPAANAKGSGNMRRSREITYRVVTPDYLDTEVYKYINALKDRITVHREKQNNAQEIINDLSAGAGDSLGRADRVALERVRGMQDAISDHARRMERVFRNVLRIYRDNRLDENDTKTSLLAAVADHFGAIHGGAGGGTSTRAAAEITRLLREESLPPAAVLGRVHDRQAETAAHLDAAMILLRKWGSFGEIKKMVMELLESEQKIHEAVRKALGSKNGGD